MHNIAARVIVHNITAHVTVHNVNANGARKHSTKGTLVRHALDPKQVFMQSCTL